MRRGFGWSDMAGGTRVTDATLFHIGSVSKTFTATAVMQLVQQGRVRLDAPFTKYVPELRLLPRFRHNRITVRSVLDHHSGIPGDVFNGLITSGKPDPKFHSWLLRTLRRMPPERRVNTEWAYNNSGYVLLERLIRNVTDRPFSEYTQRHLFRRMGMFSSGFDDRSVPATSLTSNYALTYDPNGAVSGVTLQPREYVNGWTAGSIVSSAVDMTNYLRMLVSQGRGEESRVLRARTLRRMGTPQTDLALDFGMHTGLGWLVTTADQNWMGHMIGHDGATVWNFSSLFVLPDSRLGVFVSTNTEGGSAVSDAIARRALGLAYTAKTGIPEPPPAVLPIVQARIPTPAELARYAGWYASATGYEHVVTQGDRLVWTRTSAADRHRRVLHAGQGGWWYCHEDPGVQIRFHRVAGHPLMTARGASGAAIQTLPVGERVATGHVRRSWKAATGSYIAKNANPLSLALVADQVDVRVVHGIVVLDAGDDVVQVLQPVRRDRAFTFGVGQRHGRGKGDIVTLGPNRLTYLVSPTGVPC
jgi:CubicO group peptidase (beta-lactamase class C family)